MNGEAGTARDAWQALHASALQELGGWRPADPAQDALRQTFLAYLAARPDACRRACEPGHLTASALVLDAAGEHALLTLHPRVGRWLQLGGHCEPGDTSLSAAALREAREESGLEDLTIDPRHDGPMHLDTHPITCSLGRPTRHLDVRFVLRAPPAAVPTRSAESEDLRWWPLPELAGDAELGSLLHAAAAANSA